jgi:hypothetical protein
MLETNGERVHATTVPVGHCTVNTAWVARCVQGSSCARATRVACLLCNGLRESSCIQQVPKRAVLLLQSLSPWRVAGCRVLPSVVRGRHLCTRSSNIRISSCQNGWHPRLSTYVAYVGLLNMFNTCKTMDATSCANHIMVYPAADLQLSASQPMQRERVDRQQEYLCRAAPVRVQHALCE